MSLTGRLYTSPPTKPDKKMGIFSAPTKSSNSVDAGTAVSLKPSRWRRFFRRRRRSPSVSSTLSDTASELTTTPSLDDVRIVSHVEEIVLREDTPESIVSSSASTVLSRRESTESLPPVMTRDLFSGRTIFVDALDDEQVGEIQSLDSMKSVYVDALAEEEVFEVAETMKVSVVAEIQDGNSQLDSINARFTDHYRG
jgi:hypothetical protein